MQFAGYMWVLPYSVGAFGNSSSLLGIQLTDSPAVPLLMHRELKYVI
jgi:GTP-dependent phosphoenolpyruvate carboxykinase